MINDSETLLVSHDIQAKKLASIFASVSTVVAGLGLLPADTIHAIVDQSQLVLGDLQKTIGDSYVLVGLVGPIVLAYAAKKGWTAASVKSQTTTVQNLTQNQVLTTDYKLAAEVPGVQAVSTLPSTSNYNGD